MKIKLKDKIKDDDIVKIHYKLKSLESGTVQLYYKLDDTNVYCITVDIALKSVIKSEKIKDKELALKEAINNNLDTDVKKYFENYKDRLIDENSVLNISISNTEIVINVIYDG